MPVARPSHRSRAFPECFADNEFLLLTDLRDDDRAVFVAYGDQRLSRVKGYGRNWNEARPTGYDGGCHSTDLVVDPGNIPNDGPERSVGCEQVAVVAPRHLCDRRGIILSRQCLPKIAIPELCKRDRPTS